MARGSLVETSVPPQAPETQAPDLGENDGLFSPEPIDEEQDLADFLATHNEGEGEEGVFEEEPAPPPRAVDPAAERQAQLEAEARRGGWVPLAEFRGRPGEWRSAEEFLRRGREIAGIARNELLKAQRINENLANEVAELRKLMERQTSTIQLLTKRAESADKAGYDRAIREAKQRQRLAAQSGDLAAYDDAEAEISSLEETRAVEEVPPAAEPVREMPQPQPQADLKPEVVDFIEQNDWFMRDVVLHKALETEHIFLLESQPGLPLAENLERAKAAVMKRFPDKFGIERQEPAPEPAPREQRRQSSVAEPRPRSQQSERQQATGIEAIADPRERQAAREAFTRARKADPRLSETEYLKIYMDPKADVLQVMRDADERRVARRRVSHGR